MKLTLLLATICIVAMSSSSFQNKKPVSSQDTTSVDYWKQIAKENAAKARVAEREAMNQSHMAELNAAAARKAEMLCQRQVQELKQIVDEQKKTIEGYKGKKD